MIVVTGATGHLGQWTVSTLTELGHDVVVLARRPLSSPTIDGLSWVRPVRTLECDLTDAGSVGKATPVLLDAEGVVHLAARIPEDTARDERPEATLRDSVSASLHLLQALSASSRLRALVYASSFEVYGTPASLPVSEDHSTRPETFYGAAKLSVEHYVRLFATSRSVAGSSLRLPAVYGPGDRLTRALGNFVRAAVRGGPIRIQGDGDDLRELVYARDAAEAIAAALARKARGVFNLGSGRGYRIREMAETVARLSGAADRIVDESRAKPRVDYVLSIDRARQLLGWDPRTTFEAGVRAQLDWLRRSGASS